MAENRQIVPISCKETEEVGSMAAQIWAEHYQSILSAEQISYMVEKFQSPFAIKNQLLEGYQYFWLCDGDTHAGYCSVKEEGDALFLSKIYLLKQYRGRKLASGALQFLQQLCKEKGLLRIWLTVNRYNSSSIAIYQRLGFRITREQKADIGNGFVMDDYIMELPL